MIADFFSLLPLTLGAGSIGTLLAIALAHFTED